MSTQIRYKGNTLATIENESKTLSTANKYVEDNIELVSIGGNPDGYVYQDENGFLVLDDDEDEDLVLKTRRVTYNDTYTPDEGEAYNKVIVDTNFTKNYFEKTLGVVGEADLDGVTSIGAYAFYNCTDLEEVIIPDSVTSIGNYTFYGTNLKNVTIPATVTSTNASNSFRNCGRLKTVIIMSSNLNNFDHMFQDCFTLIDVYIPRVSAGGSVVFTNCSSLLNLALQRTSECYSNAFLNCTNLQAIDFGIRTQFYRTSIFKNCTSLNTIVLRGDTLTTLTLTDVFNGTPFAEGGTGGTIYIPKVLYDELGTGSSLDYKSASNWSTFDGYGTITWAQIEGSEYENYYVDGRGVLQEITENLTNCSLDTPRSEHNMPHYGSTYTIKLIPDDGYSISSATITMGGTDITSTAFNSTTNEITIENVNDAITITATAN